MGYAEFGGIAEHIRYRCWWMMEEEDMDRLGIEDGMAEGGTGLGWEKDGYKILKRD